MDEAKNAWKDVGDRVEALGLKLKLHLDQEMDVDIDERVEGETKSAFEDMSGKVTDAFDAFGNAARDDAVHSDVRELAELIKEALIETFRAVGAEVGNLVEQIEDYAEDAADEIAEALGMDDDDDDGKKVEATDALPPLTDGNTQDSVES